MVSIILLPFGQVHRSICGFWILSVKSWSSSNLSSRTNSATCKYRENINNWYCWCCKCVTTCIFWLEKNSNNHENLCVTGLSFTDKQCTRWFIPWVNLLGIVSNHHLWRGWSFLSLDPLKCSPLQTAAGDTYWPWYSHGCIPKYMYTNYQRNGKKIQTEYAEVYM